MGRFGSVLRPVERIMSSVGGLLKAAPVSRAAVLEAAEPVSRSRNCTAYSLSPAGALVNSSPEGVLAISGRTTVAVLGSGTVGPGLLEQGVGSRGGQRGL